MSDQVLELATVTLAEGKTESELLAASEVFQRDFLDTQDGFLRRDMIRRGNGAYTDVILWQSRTHADAVFENAKNSEAAGAYFSLMKIDPDMIDQGVEHCVLLRSFQKG